MQWDYRNIKATAKTLGVSVKDLLALAPQNDPFYTGTPTDVQQAQWFADIWQRAGYTSGVHLRRVHYWCVSQQGLLMHNGKPYENTDGCWKYLTQASKMARYMGLVDIADIADNKNPPPAVSVFYRSGELSYGIDVPNLTRPKVELYGLDIPDAQPYHCELWIEKSTMNDVLAPVCETYGVNLLTFEGEVSVTACYDLIERIKNAGGKPTRIFYISDFDPAGNSMPVAMARKVEFIMHHYGHHFDVKIKHIALTIDQVQQYRLPRTPIKDSEKRAARFEENFGVGAVELDALEALQPGVLAALVDNELSTYYSEDAARAVENAHRNMRAEVQQRVSEITARYAAQIEALAQMQRELTAVVIDTAAHQVERFAPHVEESPHDWLFDSSRDYVEQMHYYKDHKKVS